MIRGLVDFALNNRFLVLAVALLLLDLGRDLVPQSAGGSLSGRREQLRSGDHAVARPRRGRGGAAGHDPHRNRR